MLETIHLTKIYKTKGGADVRALDDVSIQFPEKGMVFLLGKSGSGKSTLLNVCGGLDSPTSGAIVVKGRSSSAFSQSDFDSYRNTFVGFIFQEYNILNEFTVEDNIALALELQGKPKDKKKIAELLEQVDLAGYAKRKPNTLSGGQKQRIAIARALVKSPEIIMADEPTGALDSETGKQVFDTLKKLSKDKLVIVVSHDRDFAETYGDRIIELKDGKVISDVTKTQEETQELSSNISVIGDTLCVKRGSLLSEEEFAEIKEFLSKAVNDVIIATGEQEVKEFKENNHIRDDGGMEVFRNSEEIPVQQRVYRPEESRFIRSKLPARHAFKIGVSGMRTKPIRLGFTILLCTLAFIFFGMLSTMTFYNNESTFKQSLKDSNYSIVQMGKVYKAEETYYWEDEEGESYTYTENTNFTKEELEEYAKIFGKDAFGGITVWWDYGVQNTLAGYWSSDISYVAYLEENNSLREKIVGKYPEKADELCISSYTAEVMCKGEIYDVNTGEAIDLDKPEDVIGHKLEMNGHIYTIVGIMDSGELPAKYDELKDPETSNSVLEMGLYYELRDGLHLVAFVTEDSFEQLSDEYSYNFVMEDFESHRVAATFAWGTQDNYTFPEWGNAGYAAFSKYATADDVIALVEGKNVPADNEAVISKRMLYELILEKATTEEDAEMFELANKLYMGGEEIIDEQTGGYEYREYTEVELQEYFQQLIALVKAKNQPLTLAMKLYDDYDGITIGAQQEYTVIGICDGGEYDSNKILLSDKVAEELWATQKEQLTYFYEISTNYVVSEGAIYETLFLPYDHSDEQTNMLWDIYSNEEYAKDDSKSTLTSMLISTLEMVDMLIDALSKVFLVVGIVLAVFAALLLSNFISVSISYKKREIGILRAVGARSIDVFKIFFSESFVITFICVVISLIGNVACCSAINGVLVNLISASLFVFGPLSLIVLLAVAFITAVIATFLPVWNAAKKKPVESIRAL